jgi:hypothetical protein
VRFLLCTLLVCPFFTVAQNSSQDTSTVPEQSAHFTARFPATNTGRMAVLDSLENNYHRILLDLGIDSMPRVHFNFYPGKEALHHAVREVYPDLPSFAIGFSRNSTTVDMVSPLSGANGFGFNDLISITIHEFVHCATLHINRKFANNPRWLWESIAMYESRQYPLKASISKLSHTSAPTVEELNEKNGTRIYELGSLFTEYILTRWKKEILKELILANGDLEKVLGITEHAFETGWFEWVRTTYQLE